MIRLDPLNMDFAQITIRPLKRNVEAVRRAVRLQFYATWLQPMRNSDIKSDIAKDLKVYYTSQSSGNALTGSAIGISRRRVDVQLFDKT